MTTTPFEQLPRATVVGGRARQVLRSLVNREIHAPVALFGDSQETDTASNGAWRLQALNVYASEAFGATNQTGWRPIVTGPADDIPTDGMTAHLTDSSTVPLLNQLNFPPNWGVTGAPPTPGRASGISVASNRFARLIVSHRGVSLSPILDRQYSSVSQLLQWGTGLRVEWLLADAAGLTNPTLGQWFAHPRLFQDSGALVSSGFGTVTLPGFSAAQLQSFAFGSQPGELRRIGFNSPATAYTGGVPAEGIACNLFNSAATPFVVWGARGVTVGGTAQGMSITSCSLGGYRLSSLGAHANMWPALRQMYPDRQNMIVWISLGANDAFGSPFSTPAQYRDQLAAFVASAMSELGSGVIFVVETDGVRAIAPTGETQADYDARRANHNLYPSAAIDALKSAGASGVVLNVPRFCADAGITIQSEAASLSPTAAEWAAATAYVLGDVVQRRNLNDGAGDTATELYQALRPSTGVDPINARLGLRAWHRISPYLNRAREGGGANDHVHESVQGQTMRARWAITELRAVGAASSSVSQFVVSGSITS